MASEQCLLLFSSNVEDGRLIPAVLFMVVRLHPIVIAALGVAVRHGIDQACLPDVR